VSNNSSSGTIDFPVTASFSALSIISLLLTATFRKFSKMDSIKNRSHVHTLFDLSPSKTASSSRFIHFACLQIMMLFALFTILFRKEINSQIKLKLEIFFLFKKLLPATFTILLCCSLRKYPVGLRVVQQIRLLCIR
jgi:hypothetical protein